MVKHNFWIDAKRRDQTPTQKDAWVTGTVTEQVEDGMLAVAIDGTPEEWPDVVAPADPGVFALGANVRLLRDSTGRVIQIAAPDQLPEDTDLWGVGAGGEMIVENEQISRDLADAVAATTIELDEALDNIAAADEKIRDVVIPGLEAAQEAADAAAEQGEANRQELETQISRSDSIEADAEAAQSTADTAKDDAASAQTAATDARSAADAAAAAADAADGKATAAQSSADAAQNLASSAQSRADSAQSKADAAQTAADAAGTAASQAQATATGAQSSADAAQSKADSAASAAAAAQSTADTAKSDAAEAAGIAGGKGDVLIQSATPAASMRKATTLWIDTTVGANTPKRWDGSGWVAVTDKAATDAASAAATAQSTADQGVQDAAAAKDVANSAAAAASGAQATADAANAKASTADGRLTVASANPTTADAAGKPIGAIWEVRAGGTVLRRYCLTAATTWTQIKIGQDFIGDKAIGRAQIGDAAIGTAQIGDLQVTNGKIGDLSVDKLRVVGNAQMPTAVIDNLMSQNAFLTNLLAQRVVVGGGPNKVDSTLIEDGAVTTPKIKATEELWAAMIAVAGDATIGGDLIVDGTVDVSKLRVTGALWTELLNVAGDATIGGELLADTLRGKTLIGGRVIGSTVQTAESGVRMSLGTVLGNTKRPGIWMYDADSIYRWTTQIVADGYPSMFFYDESQNEMLRINENGVFWKDSSGARRTEIQQDSLRLFNDTPIHFYGLTESARYGVIQRRNDTDGTGLQLFGGSTSSGYWSVLSLLSASDGTKWHAQGIRGRTSTLESNIRIGTNSVLMMTSSLKRDKLDVQDQAPNWGILHVPYRSWIDKQEMIDAVLGRDCVPVDRVIGAVAEEVHTVAPELCATNPDGTLTGVQYERVGVALIPLMRDLLNRIESLEGVPITQWSDSPTYDDSAMLDEITSYGAFPPEEPSPNEPPEETV